MEIDSKAGVRKKVVRDDIIAEALDNTVSVGKITAFLESRKKTIKVHKYVSTLIRQQTQGKEVEILEHFTTFGHPLNAFGDEWDGGLPSGYFENTSHVALTPRILTDPRHIGRHDPVAQLLIEKRKWSQRIIIFKKYQNFKLKRVKPYRWMNEDVLYCPKFFVDFAVHLENNPDEFFDESYNWYYAGRGNLHTMHLEGYDYLIHSDFNTLNISPLFKDTMSIDQKNVVSFECEENIFETIQQQNFIALRMKHKIIILRIQLSEEGIQLEKLKEIKSELPYTSISFDEYHKNILYVTTLDYMLTIVNLDRMTARTMKLRGKFLTLTNNWSSVIGSERPYFVHATGNALTFYDKRTNEPVQRWKSFKSQTDFMMCNKILTTKYCSDCPQAYVGTTHHLFLNDMRYDTSSKTKPRAIMRWTHGMRSKMTYLDIGNFGSDRDIICMGSQWAPDMCYVSNYRDALSRYQEQTSVGVPHRPPDILESYNEAQRRGLLCNLYEPIIDRLMMAVTGLVAMEGDDPGILLLNSLGDISWHALVPRHRAAYIEDDGVEHLYEWTQKLKWETKPMEVSHIFDISKVWNSLKRIPDSYVLGLQTHITRRHKFNEEEIYQTFESGEVDSAFLEVWKDDGDGEITLNQTEPMNTSLDNEAFFSQNLTESMNMMTSSR